MESPEVPKAVESHETVKIPSVQVVLLRKGAQELEVYLGRRSAGGFLNQWSVPGGKIDEGETPLQAACRELEEETGLKVQSENLVFLRTESSTTMREKDGTQVAYEYEFNIYITFVHEEEPRNASPDEYAQTGWFTLTDALEMHKRAVSKAVGLSSDKIEDALTPRVADTIERLVREGIPN